MKKLVKTTKHYQKIEAQYYALSRKYLMKESLLEQLKAENKRLSKYFNVSFK